MVRTQIQLDEAQYEEVRRIAHRQRISMAEAIRRILDGVLGSGRRRRQSGARALLEIAGMGRSGRKDLGRRHDAYLAGVKW